MVFGYCFIQWYYLLGKRKGVLGMLWDITYKVGSVMTNIIIICFTIGISALCSIICISPVIAIIKAGVDKIRNKDKKLKRRRNK